MNPETYAALYGPYRPVPRRRRTDTLLTVVAVLLWLVTLFPFGLLTFLMGTASLWALADGTPWAEVRGMLLVYVLIPALAAAALTALGFVPPLRRLRLPARLAVLGAMACPLSLGAGLWTWLTIG
ncbi:hypothetical protein [Streptomyces sp. NPDC005435]|uniref:hypothetical protein n=1 Tax=Streptomyces sp. NPDC005435 TaxID=3154464 RepID=UPI003455E00E